MQAQHRTAVIRTPDFTFDLSPWDRDRELWNWTQRRTTQPQKGAQKQGSDRYLTKSTTPESGKMLKLHSACIGLFKKYYLLVSLKMTFQCLNVWSSVYVSPWKAEYPAKAKCKEANNKLHLNKHCLLDSWNIWATSDFWNLKATQGILPQMILLDIQNDELKFWPIIIHCRGGSYLSTSQVTALYFCVLFFPQWCLSGSLLQGQ